MPLIEVFDEKLFPKGKRKLALALLFCLLRDLEGRIGLAQLRVRIDMVLEVLRIEREIDGET